MRKLIRKAFVSGSFYPGTENAIREQLQIVKNHLNYTFPDGLIVNHIFGGVLPHAGHVYSAYQTLAFFETLVHSATDFDSFIILHPLHRGGYLDFASDGHDSWETPLGELAVDKEFLKAMDVDISSEMLDNEHSAEVLLPYIQFYNFQDKMIIPIGIAKQEPNISQVISSKILKAQKLTSRKVCIIASSDFSHFLSPEKGFQQDQKVLDCIEQKDIICVYDTIQKENISVCGYGPIMSLMEYSGLMNTHYQNKILNRGHSGEVSPSDSVVDYISMLFFD